MNNDLAVGAKGKIPSGEFYTKRLGKMASYESAIFNGMGQGDVLLLRFKWQILLQLLLIEVGILQTYCKIY